MNSGTLKLAAIDRCTVTWLDNLHCTLRTIYWMVYDYTEYIKGTCTQYQIKSMSLWKLHCFKLIYYTSKF